MFNPIVTSAWFMVFTVMVCRLKLIVILLIVLNLVAIFMCKNYV